MNIAIHPANPGEVREALIVCHLAFGKEGHPAELSWQERIAEPARLLCAVEGGHIVGTAGSYSLDVSVPGAILPAAGVTLVGVLPSYRRRGLLTRFIGLQLADAANRGEAVAILWSSEGGIYQRFGYGLASRSARIDIERTRAVFMNASEPSDDVRGVSLIAAREMLPVLYEEHRCERAGLISRPEAWWEHLLSDQEYQRAGAGPMFCAVVNGDTRLEAYVLYRVREKWVEGVSEAVLDVIEFVSVSPAATQKIWRHLFSMDLIARIHAELCPVDHPLFLMLQEPRRLGMTLGDALWLRVVDVEAALGARSYASGEAVTFEVVDTLRPENHGRWKLEAQPPEGRIERVQTEAELRLGIDALGAVYLGGSTFSDLVAAGSVLELVSGAASRADRLFRTDLAPWCAEIF